MFNPSLKRSRIPEPEVSVSSPDIKNEAAQDEGVPAKRLRKNAKSWSCFYFKRAWLSVCQEFGLPQVSGGQLLNQFQHQPPLLFRLTSELTSEIRPEDAVVAEEGAVAGEEEEAVAEE
jgi:hypothetical protein